MSEDTIISCLSNDLFVEPNLIVEEIMTASNLKASLRLAVEDFANYPMLLEKLASKFQCLPFLLDQPNLVGRGGTSLQL